MVILHFTVYSYGLLLRIYVIFLSITISKLVHIDFERYKLVPIINQKIQEFVENPHQRLKCNTPNLGDWLTYLTVAPNARWSNVATIYLHETFLCNVLWYVKDHALADVNNSPVNHARVEDAFHLTKVSRDLIAFQVLFFDIARPSNLTLEQALSPLIASPSSLPSPSLFPSLSFS
jgi:hypothetical protein